MDTWWLPDDVAAPMRANGDECIDPARDEEKSREMRGENEGEAEVPVRGHIFNSQ